jgi:hypothetical protein
VVVEFKNNSLSPQRGLSSTPFAYSIMVNASKKIDVGLNVLDIATKSFQTVGRTSYTNVSQWEAFLWKDIRPTSQIDLTGSSNHYYSFYYPGAETPFNTTYEMLGKYFPGPDLVLVELYNQTVTPINGTAFTPYTYSVEVKTARPRADIELQTSPPGSVIWSGRGTVTYDGSNDTLVWKNVTFSESVQSVGDGRYRFVLDDVVLGAFLGPNLDIAFKDATYERIGQTDRFDYKVKVRSSSPRLTLELVYSDDGVTWVHSKLYQVYESSSQEWKELVWKNQPWHQTVRFDEVRR